MNKQHLIKREQVVVTKRKKPGFSRRSLLFSNVITFSVAVCLFWVTNYLFAQTMNLNLNGGDSVAVVCNGRRFQVQRISRVEFNMTCVAQPDQTPPGPTPTNVPPVGTPIVPTPTSPPPIPTALPPAPTNEPPVIIGNAYYVSGNGSNGDGRSWTTAWNELDQINWAAIQPGDTIFIDGGTAQMRYRTILAPRSSGTAGAPIRIQLSTEAGHNGQAVIFGGRDSLLPFCGQTNYSYQESGVLAYGAILENVSWIVIDGRKWAGITIHGTNGNGIRFYDNTSNITLRNMELYDNGAAVFSNGSWHSDGKGIRLEGANHTVERMIIHDNGQDAIQSNGTNVSNFTIRESWLYNGREHPDLDQSYNWCTHSDALQIYDGGVVSGITVEDSILGPGFTNTLLLGDRTVNVNDVTLSNVLMLKAAENGISAHSSATTDVRNWSIRNITVYSPNTAYNAITYKGTELTITDSIFVGSHVNIPNTTPSVRGNCQWQTTGVAIGTEADPQFVNAVPDAFSNGDYDTHAGSCRGKGATITSVDQLLSLPSN